VAEEPSKAITSGAVTELVHPFEDRFLTIRECARIQTFPDSFQFVGNGQQVMLQIGNAVPPRLAESIASSLRDDLDAQAEQPIARGRGALLSFAVTDSLGMSPALQTLVRAVETKCLAPSQQNEEQLSLWD
jgi:DNA (cytosine-5)-methyltransferase 1